MLLVICFIYDSSVRTRELDIMILMSPFQLEIFYVSAIFLSCLIDFREVRNESVITLG